ncbi:DUF4446 family protein [Euzebya tangerina]|uniref:DUF4446 family protein n=1 Tax=Euzebya tangerina TaxID=591198 RepID=UPI000E31FC89|nr:DUF4446 family protein [Euzebya tangerina]
MELSPGLVGTLLVVSILLSGAALIAGIMAVQAQRKVTRTYGRFARGRREDVVTLLEMHMDEVKRLQRLVRSQQAYARQLRGVLSRSLSRIGTVRYDAFDDMGGRLSFSIALLDEHGDGSVITAMNGRVQTRTYAKPVTGGSSSHNLSEEEVQAIAQAMDGGARRAAEVAAALPIPDEHLLEGEQADEVPAAAVGAPPAPEQVAAASEVGEHAGPPRRSATPGPDDPLERDVPEEAAVEQPALQGAGLTPRRRQSVVPTDFNPADRPRPAAEPAAGEPLPPADALPSTGMPADQASQAAQTEQAEA